MEKITLGVLCIVIVVMLGIASDYLQRSCSSVHEWFGTKTRDNRFLLRHFWFYRDYNGARGILAIILFLLSFALIISGLKEIETEATGRERVSQENTQLEYKLYEKDQEKNAPSCVKNYSLT